MKQWAPHASRRTTKQILRCSEEDVQWIYNFINQQFQLPQISGIILIADASRKAASRSSNLWASDTSYTVSLKGSIFN